MIRGYDLPREINIYMTTATGGWEAQSDFVYGISAQKEHFLSALYEKTHKTQNHLSGRGVRVWGVFSFLNRLMYILYPKGRVLYTYERENFFLVGKKLCFFFFSKLGPSGPPHQFRGGGIFLFGVPSSWREIKGG